MYVCIQTVTQAYMCIYNVSTCTACPYLSMDGLDACIIFYRSFVLVGGCVKVCVSVCVCVYIGRVYRRGRR